MENIRRIDSDFVPCPDIYVQLTDGTIVPALIDSEEFISDSIDEKATMKEGIPSEVERLIASPGLSPMQRAMLSANLQGVYSDGNDAQKSSILRIAQDYFGL